MNRIIALLLALAATLAGCTPPPPPEPTAIPTPEPVLIEITAEDIRWSQTEVTVAAGQQVTFRIRNDGGLDHDFVIDALGVHLHVLTGETREVTVTFPEPGTLEFYCSVPGHIDAGMFGSITVTAPQD